MSVHIPQVIDKCVQYDPSSRSDISLILKSSFFVKMRNKCVDLNTELNNKYSCYSSSQDNHIKIDNNNNNSSTKGANGDSCTWVFN